jgi:hypothetical protein
MAGSVRLLLLCLLGFCVAVSHQKSDSCAGNLAVAKLVPFDTDGFRCITLWKQEDFILRVRCSFWQHICLSYMLFFSLKFSLATPDLQW